MAINTNFYQTINELVNNGLSGSVGEHPVTDYTTFVQTGHSLNDLNGGELANNFIKNLMNKTALTLSTFRSYKGRYDDIFRGSLDNGNNIELIVQGFYEAREPQFANLTDGQSVDHYKIALPEVHTKYYTDSNAYQIPVTISKSQLRKAWESPAAMDSFIQSIIGSVLNSNEMQRQIGRQAAVTNAIAIGMGADPSTMLCTTAPITGVCVGTLDAPGGSVQALVIDTWNDKINKEFYTNSDKLRTAVAKIRSTLHKMGEYSEKYNPEGVPTFTPDSGKRLYLLDDFAKACDAHIYQGAFNPEYNQLVDYVDISYWKNADYPWMTVESPEGSYRNWYDSRVDNNVCYAVVALAFDEFAIMEYLKQQTMDVTPLNAGGQYWNYYLNVDTQLINNLMANCVPFYIESYWS